MKFSILVAKKFLLRDKKSAPSKITGLIAVVGLAVGCIAMVLSLSVLNGFENRIINKIIGFESDLRLTQADDWESAIDIIPEIKGVKAIMPFQERKALIIGRGGTQRMVSLKAVDIDKIFSFYDFDFSNDVSYAKMPIVYLGEMTARRLNVNKGEVIRLFSPIDHG